MSKHTPKLNEGKYGVFVNNYLDGSGGCEVKLVQVQNGEDVHIAFFYEDVKGAMDVADRLNAVHSFKTSDLEDGIVGEMVGVLREFVARVECGEVRSKYTYGKMKALLSKIEGD